MFIYTDQQSKYKPLDHASPVTVSSCSAGKLGGQPSNRPPAKVDLPGFIPTKILASGVDSLVLSLTAKISNPILFETFEALKEKAQVEDNPVEGILEPDNDCKPWKFIMRSHGIRGYSWLLDGKDYFLKFLNLMEPGKRPNIIVEIRSETLHSNGLIHSTEYILDVLEGLGIELISVKPSRIDLFMDIRLDERLWQSSLKNYAVTRANLKSTWNYGSKFTGLSIGKGNICARLYDKINEIVLHSNKAWMFLVWGDTSQYFIEGVKIIRVEFQHRREALKALINCDVFNTFEYLDRIWAYDTQEWLKFQDNPGEHHSKRENFPWWDTVQNGFQGVQSPTPLVRKKAYKQEKKQLCAQVYGLLTSLHAIILEEQDKSINYAVTFDGMVNTLVNQSRLSNTERVSDPEIITQDVSKKRARYHRIK